MDHGAEGVPQRTRIMTAADILKKEVLSSKRNQEAHVAKNTGSEGKEEACYSCGRGRNGFGYCYQGHSSGWISLLKNKFNFTDVKKF